METLALAGVDWIQIREKDLPGKAIAALTRNALERVAKQASPSQATTRLLVNDRLDLAFAECAGGVHLGENSLPVSDTKRLARALQGAQSRSGDFLVGVSCHSLESAKSAAMSGADYVFFGPIFATPSKAPYGAPQGLQRLAEVCAAVRIPVLAIGGITLENVSSCFAAGASGIAAIRLFQDAPDPVALVSVIRRRIA
jgi:thiamine-phosphate pyrophosphorylase